MTDAGRVPEGHDDKLERLAERLRTLRRRLTGDPPDVDRWELDLYSYDETLVVTADLLDVPVPPGARDEMGPEARTALEDGLAAAGVDVRGAMAAGTDHGMAGDERDDSAEGGAGQQGRGRVQ